MKKDKRHEALTYIHPFHTPTFLTRMLDDLRPHLGKHYPDLLTSLLDGPSAFRAKCESLLDREAEAYVSISLSLIHI